MLFYAHLLKKISGTAYAVNNEQNVAYVNRYVAADGGVKLYV